MAGPAWCPPSDRRHRVQTRLAWSRSYNAPMKMPPGTATRVAAARVLDAVLHHGRSLKAELAAALPGLADPRDRALVEAICLAALRQIPRYDAALAAWLPRPLSRKDRPLRALLLAGFAQLDPLGLPPHAAVASTVEAARALGRTHQAKLVNALLRRAQREGLPPAVPGAGWPDWLLEQLRRDWPQHWESILAASTVLPAMWLRVNAGLVGRDEYRVRLEQAGIEAAADPLLPDALRLDQPLPVTSLPGFAEGLVSVQDGSAQQVVEALAPRPGSRVLDACAAPGGKAAHLLERQPSLQLLALDSDGLRLKRIGENLSRLRLEGNATLRPADATDTAQWWDGRPFDAVLLDAPCSATGVIRRHPDVLLHRKAADLDALVALQGRLLDALWPTVAPGGTLLYATCSLLAVENSGQVDAFLARTPDAVADPLPEQFGHAAGAGRQRLPGEQGMDGFFYARLRRQA